MAYLRVKDRSFQYKSLSSKKLLWWIVLSLSDQLTTTCKKDLKKSLMRRKCLVLSWIVLETMVIQIKYSKIFIKTIIISKGNRMRNCNILEVMRRNLWKHLAFSYPNKLKLNVYIHLSLNTLQSIFLKTIKMRLKAPNL